MSAPKAGGSIFPKAATQTELHGPVGGSPGMTFRDYFAAKAMQGLLVNGADEEPERVATYAVIYADALLAALAKPEAKAQEKGCSTCRYEEQDFDKSPCNMCDSICAFNRWEAKR